MLAGIHLAVLLPLFVAFVVPMILGFLFVLPDATRRGQQGWLWALSTIPLGWFALLAYLIVRTTRPSGPSR